MSCYKFGYDSQAALEEHFSAYGDLSSVVLEGLSELQESNDASLSSNVSARVAFTTRRSAEKAFLHGKVWQGHKLQFVWLTSKEVGISGNPPSASKVVSNTSIQPSGNDTSADHQEVVEADVGSVEPDKERESKSASTSSSSESKRSSCS